MTAKTEAERLADELNAGAEDPMWANHCEMPKSICRKAAAELSRLESLFEAAKAVGIRQEQSIIDLEAEVERLTAALAAERERCAMIVDCWPQFIGGMKDDIAAAIRAEAKGE